MYLYSIVISQIFGQICRGKLIFLAIFSLFRVDFHAVRLFFAYYGLFLRFLGNFLAGSGVGDKYGSILGFSTFCVFAFLTFLGRFWALFGFQCTFGHLGITSEL